MTKTSLHDISSHNGAVRRDKFRFNSCRHRLLHVTGINVRIIKEILDRSSIAVEVDIIDPRVIPVSCVIPVVPVYWRVRGVGLNNANVALDRISLSVIWIHVGTPGNPS